MVVCKVSRRLCLHFFYFITNKAALITTTTNYFGAVTHIERRFQFRLINRRVTAGSELFQFLTGGFNRV